MEIANIKKLPVKELVESMASQTGGNFTLEKVEGVGLRILKDGKVYSHFFDNDKGLRFWLSTWWLGYSFARSAK